MAKRRILSQVTPLGHTVVLTRDRWREIIRFKHPALAGHEMRVRDCVKDPNLIRTSSKDPDAHLYYKNLGNEYICVVVAGDDPNERFVVTAYFTKSPKKGTDLWTK